MSFSVINPQQISQLDPGGALKNSHDYNGQAFRVRDTVAAVQDYFSHYKVTYDASDNPVQIEYLLGLQPHITQIATTSDSSGSLNNKYFFAYEPVSQKQYYFWYNVSGGGTDPNIADSIGVEIPIQTNDDSTIVALATELAINDDQVSSRFFDARRINGSVKITSKRPGLASSSVDGNTGFLIANTAGAQKIVQTIDIEYNGSNPIWEGQELIGYKYNVFTGKFELLVDVGDITVDFSPVTAQEPSIVNLTLGLAGSESSTVLPPNTVKYTINARGNGKLQFSFTSGQSGSNFITVPKGAKHIDKDLELVTNKTIYVQSPDKDNEVVEILYWT
jgi:hypothetical protein